MKKILALVAAIAVVVVVGCDSPKPGVTTKTVTTGKM